MTASRHILPLHVLQRLQQLSALPAETDDEDQLPPTAGARAAVKTALTALTSSAPQAVDAVFISPTYDGGIALEWATEDERHLIVTVPPEHGSRFTVFRYSVEPRFEEDLPAENLSALPELLSWLTNGDGVRGRQLVNVRDNEERWDQRLAAAGDVLARLAEQALADERTGRTAPLDLDDR